MADKGSKIVNAREIQLMYRWMSQAAITIENPYIPNSTAEGKFVEGTIEFKQRSLEIQHLWDSDEKYRRYLNSLCEIEVFICEVLANKNPDSPLIENDMRLLEKYFDKVREFAERYKSNYILSQHVQLFFDCWIALDLGLKGFHNRRDVSYKVWMHQHEVFNNLLDLIRIKEQSPQFKQKLALRKDKSSKRYRGAKSYVGRLFDNHSVLEVIRIDLSFRNDLAISMAAEGAKEYFQKFKNNLRGKPSLFDDMVGHIWKLGWAPEKGFYFHLILLFVDSDTFNSENVARQIGEYWIQKICNGNGVFMNSNVSEHSDRNLGTGKIKADESEKMKILVSVAERMAKMDQYLQPTPLGEGKLFGHGALNNT